MQLMLSHSSPYARAVRIAIMLKGLDSECSMVWVDPASNTPELVQANPSVKVPTLILDDGTTLTETLLIMQYLERRAPNPPLFPNAQAIQEMSLAGRAIGLLDATVWMMLFNKSLATDENRNSVLPTRRLRAIERLLDELAEHPPRVVGATPGMGQILLLCALEYLEFRFPEMNATERAKLVEWCKPLKASEPFHLTEFY